MSTDAPPVSEPVASVVLHVGRQFRASEKAVVEAALERRPGVVSVEANPVAQTAAVTPHAGRPPCSQGSVLTDRRRYRRWP